MPDFNQSTIAMGQHLLNPPSVAGWAGGRAWITPGLLMARGNVAREVLIPDMTGFRDWNFSAGSDDVLGRRLRDGYDIGAATALNDPSTMSTFDMVALERDERFNTRISGYIGWQQAARKLIPTPRRRGQVRPRRDAARGRRDHDGRGGGLPDGAAAPRAGRPSATRDAFVAFLTRELGTDSIERARTYMEDALRMTAHLIMSTAEYQLV